ncbi:MAG TPA: toll/interleukin-1 receptor domain-containing protein, partial [Candidatus Binatia bacterium]
MKQIFISYASKDRERARVIAAALGGHGWDVWWDREIPLGKAFDEIIEKAIAEAKCVIVLWSAASVASEWVRNEASEGKRRGILVPVFIEQIEAPLAFRSLNGADLSAWSGKG